MSVLIKMDMPKSCPCELIDVGYDLYCSFTSGSPARVKEYDECCRNNTRPAWCPLSEVPVHGRLIDADALISQCQDEKGSYYGHESAIIGEAVESAPTVIEAEE